MKNELRIIAGEWRGRKIGFTPVDGLRPTPGRVRETLFNWLQEDIAGAECLDLFSGSGALGFEAASRGARQVTLVDSHRQVVARLQDNIESLNAGARVRVVQSPVDRFLARPTRPCQLVFMDPPFRQNLLLPACRALQENGWLAPLAKIYLEAEADTPLPALPEQWLPLKAKKAGDVAYYLFQLTD